jgi:hypothetical protein
MFADLDRSDGTRDAPSLTRLVIGLDIVFGLIVFGHDVRALWQVAAKG